MSNMMDDFFNAPDKDGDFDHNAGSNPKPHEGVQIAMVKIYGPKTTKKKGDILRVDLMIVQPAPGSSYAQGAHCGLAWYINESDMVKRQYERSRAGEFVIALLGLPPKTVYGPHSKRLSQQDQPGRGVLVKIIGERNGQYLNYRYEHIPQTNEQIVANRAVVDRVSAAQEQANGLPPGAQQTPPQHMQQAPHPSQMPQQYPAQQQYAQLPQGQGSYTGAPTQQQFYPGTGYPQPQQPTVPAQPQVGIPGLPGIKF